MTKQSPKNDPTQLRPKFFPGILPGPVCWKTVFGNEKPLELELGFGRPHFLLERAAESPASNVIGVEWKAKWSKVANKRMVRLGLNNVCALHGNAWHLLGSLFQKPMLRAIYLNFPDPWWKSKHRKRRIINPTFANLLASRLEPNGTLLIQTDVASLLEQMLESLEQHPDLENRYGSGRLCPRKPTAASSHREKKCRSEGIPIFRALLSKHEAR
jgi:tRNA (guanine-N7-)-methyltransferase